MSKLRMLALVTAAGAALGLVLLWIRTRPAVVPAAALPPYAANVDNGRIMFEIGGCASCHAVPDKDPAKVDRTRLGGGRPLNSPFGTFYVPNISSDPNDGIGAWSEADFVTALVEGDLGAAATISIRPFPTRPTSICGLPMSGSVRLSEDPAAGRG